MALIDWGLKLSVGIEKIDEQHKKLIDLINELNAAMRNKQAKTVLANILTELSKYTKTHFQTEEVYFKTFNYPETKAHIVEHENFIKKISDFQESLKADDACLSIEIMKFLRDWLVNHILKTDMQYKVFFVEHGLK
jgi:hemerythrin-like metal-binding protein